MRPPRLPRALPLLPWLMLLAACSAPPKPPTVDESRKRPANTALAVDLQVCHGELHNTRILSSEQAHEAEQHGAAMARMVQQQRVLVDRLRATAAPAADLRNTLHMLTFPFAGTRVALEGAPARELLAQAREAPLVLLRGRTDGRSENPGESRVARERAEAVRDWLVRGGVPPARIRTTWQPVGDHAADNALPGGQALNRRVEIELYRAAPRLVGAGSGETTAGAGTDRQPMAGPEIGGPHGRHP